MCGIYGFTTKFPDIEKAEILKHMGQALRHRGPDQSGNYLDDNVAMGIERLSILDVEKGRQPIYSNNGRCVIVHNGEVYNYREIRDKLKKMGYHFQTNTDTEVIVNLYQHKGLDCLSDLNGMFAFAIMDPIRKQLYLARDHFGKKPLYFFFQDGIFIFGSEIKAILQSPVVHDVIEIDDRALVDYMSIGYILTPKTIFQQIKQLQPASYAIIDCLQKTFTEKKYPYK